MTERKLPQNIEAEQSVLGSVFISKSALQKVIEDLEKDSFYSSDNSKIYEVLKELYIEGVAIDVTTVSDRLKKKKYFSSSLSAEYLLEIVNSVPTAANVDYYISIVKEKAISRKLIDTATNIATVAYSESEDIGEMLDDAERKILNVVKNRRATEFKNIQDVLFRAQANLEKLSEAGSDITGVASGFHDLDKLTTGFHENELIIVAARPGMGKTAFVLNIATNVASSTKKAVAVFNMEMNAEQLTMRMISSVGQIDGYRIRTGKLENNDWKRVNEAISQLANTNLKIDDTPGITVGEIRAKCRRLASSEEGLELIIIDYLQLVNVGGKNSDNRQQEVAEISRSLKELSLELNVPIIACAQLNRSVDSREDKRPLMSDLRESGSI